MHHAKQVQYCAKGMRYFAKKNSLDMAEFIANGLDEDVLLATGDDTARKVVEIARKENG
jgi:hypothetical protein